MNQGNYEHPFMVYAQMKIIPSTEMYGLNMYDQGFFCKHYSRGVSMLWHNKITSTYNRSHNFTLGVIFHGLVPVSVTHILQDYYKATGVSIK